MVNSMLYIERINRQSHLVKSHELMGLACLPFLAGNRIPFQCSVDTRFLHPFFHQVSTLLCKYHDFLLLRSTKTLLRSSHDLFLIMLWSFAKYLKLEEPYVRNYTVKNHYQSSCLINSHINSLY